MEIAPSTKIELFFNNNCSGTFTYEQIHPFKVLKTQLEDCGNKKNMACWLLSDGSTPELFAKAVALPEKIAPHKSLYDMYPEISVDETLQLFKIAHEYDNEALLAFLAASLIHIPLDDFEKKEKRINNDIVAFYDKIQIENIIWKSFYKDRK